MIQAVEAFVAPRLESGKASRRCAAKAFTMSERTFTRRLAQCNTSYKEVVDEVRRKIALSCLSYTDMRIDAIAYDLGYANQNSFNHAMKRWTGMGPREYRRT